MFQSDMIKSVISESKDYRRITALLNKSGHSNSYNCTFAPIEDSDQPAHPRSLNRVFAGHMKMVQALIYLQNAQRQLRVITGCTCSFVGNAVPRLKTVISLSTLVVNILQLYHPEEVTH